MLDRKIELVVVKRTIRFFPHSYYIVAMSYENVNSHTVRIFIINVHLKFISEKNIFLLYLE